MQPISFSKLPDAILGNISEFVMGAPHLQLPKKENDTSIFQVNKQTKAAKKEYCKRCQSVTIHEKFNENVFRGITSTLPRCHTITMTNDASFITPEDFDAILTTKVQYQQLHLRGVQLITDAQIRSLIEKQAQLEELTLDRCSKLSNETMQYLCQTLTNLRSLSLTISLGLSTVTPQAFSQLSKLQNLESLSLNVPKIDTSVMKEIVKLDNLKHLHFGDGIFYMSATDSGLLANSKAPYESLRFTPTAELENQAYENLFEKKPTLKKLEIVNFNRRDLTSFKSLVNLEELVLQGANGLTNETLKVLASLPKLKTVRISHAPSLTQSGVQDAQKLRADLQIELVPEKPQVNPFANPFEALGAQMFGPNSIFNLNTQNLFPAFPQMPQFPVLPPMQQLTFPPMHPFYIYQNFLRR